MIRNLAELFFSKSAKHPEKTALIFPVLNEQGELVREDVYTFQEMMEKVRRLHTGLRSRGIGKGDQALLLAPLTPDVYALVIALFSVGAAPLFLDAAMGTRKMMKIIRQQKPKAIFSVEKLWRWRLLLPATWSAQKFSFDSAHGNVADFSRLYHNLGPTEFATMHDNDLALITYTTGSTGSPKGADRSFGVLLKQHELSQQHWPEIENEVDMPCFPMIALQNMACGITTILPAMNLQQPSSVNATEIVGQIRRHAVTRMSGSPAYLLKVFKYLKESQMKLPQIRSLIAGGATVPRELCELVEEHLPNSKNYVVYGSTEVEPISFTSMKEILNSPSMGFLVGNPLPELQVRIVNDLSPHLKEFSKYGPDLYRTNEVGEVIVTGPHVVKRYLNNKKANFETKLQDPEGNIWHRTGDLAYHDEQGRIVLVGRLKDQVQSQLGPVANYLIEQRLESIPGVLRAGVLNSKKGPITFIQASENTIASETSSKVRDVLEQFYLKNSPVQWIEKMPVDHRHNWKINRELLKENHR